MTLTDVERRLVCGDPDVEGWSDVPVNQATYFLRAFLQERGHHDPTFAVRNGRLEVDAGPRSRIRTLRARGLPPGADASKLRRLTGVDLTPKSLDRIKAAITRLLQTRGYACPELAIKADAETGAVDVDADHGGLRLLDEVVPARLEKINPAIFSRYEAFRRGAPFDSRLLTLTADRTLADSLFVSAYYDVNCTTAGLRVTQRVVEGKPRVYKIGAGFDTEDYAIAKAQWKDARLNARGSSLEGILYGSFRRQSAEVLLRHFVDPESRLHIKPRFLYDREDRAAYESIEAEFSVMPATSWENDDFRADLSAGPSRHWVRTVRGPGPDNDTYLALKTQWTVLDHLFEFHAGEPREGWKASLDTVSRLAGIDSALTAHRISFQGEVLWNVGNFDPPLVVVGDRWWAGTTYSDSRATALRGLPPEMRFYLGGDANMRGAPLKGLPNDDAGFLTALYDGVEVRLGEVIGRGFQPLVFLDAAVGGRADFELDPDVYWAPGAGFRWALPVGAIRATAARGLIWRRELTDPPAFKPRWQFYFSFGREF